MARRIAVGSKWRCFVVGLAVILILISGANDPLLRQKEAILRKALFDLREQIDNYTLGKEKSPQKLDALVAAGYLKEIPVDPFTGSNQTWVPVTEHIAMSIDQTETGITDVHSGSNAIGRDGTSYATW